MVDRRNAGRAPRACWSRGAGWRTGTTRHRPGAAPSAPHPASQLDHHRQPRSGEGGFRAESGRYHLHVSPACPRTHRTLIFRRLKGLEPHIGVSVMHPDMPDDGRGFRTDFPGTTGDRLYGLRLQRELCLKADPEATTRVTVPVPRDRRRETIASKESADIIRMFNEAFDHLTGNRDDWYPEPLRAEIDTLNARIHATVNNGAYRCGFATSQEAFDEVFGRRSTASPG